MSTAAKVQAAVDSALKAAREHDLGELQKVRDALERIREDVALIGAASVEITLPYVGAHLTALKSDHERAVNAIANGLHEVSMALDTPNNG